MEAKQRYQIVPIDVYEGDRFVITNRLKVRQVYSFALSRWVVTPETLEEALDKRYPEIRKSERYRFLV